MIDEVKNPSLLVRKRALESSPGHGDPWQRSHCLYVNSSPYRSGTGKRRDKRSRSVRPFLRRAGCSCNRSRRAARCRRLAATTPARAERTAAIVSHRRAVPPVALIRAETPVGETATTAASVTLWPYFRMRRSDRMSTMVALTLPSPPLRRFLGQLQSPFDAIESFAGLRCPFLQRRAMRASKRHDPRLRATGPRGQKLDSAGNGTFQPLQPFIDGAQIAQYRVFSAGYRSCGIPPSVQRQVVLDPSRIMSLTRTRFCRASTAGCSPRRCCPSRSLRSSSATPRSWASMPRSSPAQPQGPASSRQPPRAARHYRRSVAAQEPRRAARLRPARGYVQGSRRGGPSCDRESAPRVVPI